MNIHNIEYFIVLARELNFTRAANQLHITQQSLSSSIASLEEELGTKLVIRHVPLELTYAGKVFLDFSKKFQDDLKRLSEEFCDITENQKGLLKVGVAITRGHIIMPDIISAFQKKYPNIAVELVEGSNAEVHRNLQNGEIDVGIAFFDGSNNTFEVENFYSERVVFIIAKDLFNSLYQGRENELKGKIFTSNISDLKDCPFIEGNLNDITNNLFHDLLKQNGIDYPIIKAKSRNMETILALCARGVGACFCPENLAKNILTQEELDNCNIFYLGDKAKFFVNFAYSVKSHQWSIISEFIKVAKEYVKV